VDDLTLTGADLASIEKTAEFLAVVLPFLAPLTPASPSPYPAGPMPPTKSPRDSMNVALYAKDSLECHIH
jgi:hypothetical protein